MKWRGRYTRPGYAPRPAARPARQRAPPGSAARWLGSRSRFETAFGPAAVTHVNLNDGVVEGLRLLDAPAFSVQYHPEAAPGPHDAAGLFQQFCAAMERPR